MILNSQLQYETKKLFLFLLFFISPPKQIYAALDDYLPLDTGYSSSYFGDTGLAILPTARFQDEGTLKFGLSSFYPYEITSIAASPFPWMEAVFRYTEIKNEKNAMQHHDLSRPEWISLRQESIDRNCNNKKQKTQLFTTIRLY